ncbi:MAG: 4Fe-4S dicluster domain-containing protein [Candidatus Omnitrophota bacterium]|nr:4Fe-4S dicluster domain-containing protein [Candidatus Omnitrophota bacterium]
MKNDGPLAGINNFFKQLLAKKIVDVLLVPQDTPAKTSVVQTLVRAEGQIVSANPFAPLLLMNSATLVGQLTVDKPKERVGAVMRSCEVRAVIELAKLKQVNIDNLVIIGVDCLGTYEPNTYQEIVPKFKDNKALTMDFLSEGKKPGMDASGQDKLRLACRWCEYPNPENTDIAINFLGCDINKEIFIQFSEKIDKINPEGLGLLPADDISKWQEASRLCRDERTKVRDRLFEEALNLLKDAKDLVKELGRCRRCYNCRRACPICYCRACIFDTVLFEHNYRQYFQWAAKKGKIRMPTDTLLYHLTRMNHMIVSCVGCGQCTSACPNNIPVAKFFKTIGAKVQALFDYKPGRSVEEEIPQATFKEDEFREVGK